MKPSLLKHYFDGNYFLNTVTAAAFAERALWPVEELVMLMVLVMTELKAPECPNPYRHLEGWRLSGWLLSEKMESGKLVVRPGKTSTGLDVRQLTELRPEIVAAVRLCIAKAEKHERFVAAALAESPLPAPRS